MRICVGIDKSESLIEKIRRKEWALSPKVWESTFSKNVKAIFRTQKGPNRPEAHRALWLFSILFPSEFQEKAVFKGSFKNFIQVVKNS